jgi:hypothetical protein
MTVHEANTIIREEFARAGRQWTNGESLTVVERDGQLYVTDANMGPGNGRRSHNPPLAASIGPAGIRHHARGWLRATATDEEAP